MKTVHRGIAVAVLQCLIVLSVAAKYATDRVRLPRVWVKTVPYDPNLPIRGRYLSMMLEVDAPGANGYWTPARLSVENGRLVASPTSVNTGVVVNGSGPNARLAEPVAFFISERAADPSRRPPGEELWVEVSVPKKGPPRPIRLGVKKDGAIAPLDLR